MSEQNKSMARRVFEEAFGGGDLEVVDEAYAADFEDHDPSTPPEMAHGPEGIKQQVQMYRAAFPDLDVGTEAQYADGDVVITRWTARGTHQGELMGVPPSGKSVSVTGITIDRFAEGKIQEEWTNWDGLGLMQQIGAIPSD